MVETIDLMTTRRRALTDASLTVAPINISRNRVNLSGASFFVKKSATLSSVGTHCTLSSRFSTRSWNLNHSMSKWRLRFVTPAVVSAIAAVLSQWIGVSLIEVPVSASYICRCHWFSFPTIVRAEHSGGHHSLDCMWVVCCHISMNKEHPSCCRSTSVLVVRGGINVSTERRCTFHFAEGETQASSAGEVLQYSYEPSPQFEGRLWDPVYCYIIEKPH